MNAIEFFSGIGGLHYALSAAIPNAKVVAAFDINQHANITYNHNFHLEPITRSIEHLNIADIDSYDAHIWLLSPPCQPHTQGGNRKDENDPRSTGFLHLLHLLPLLKRIPNYIFLENVPNFEHSNSRNQLVLLLKSLDFEIKEFMISPLQLGIPNDRKRYYLAACRRELSCISENVKPEPSTISGYLITSLDRKCEISSLSEIIQELDDYTPFYVPDAYILKRHNYRYDIVKYSDKRSSCMTKAYGSHHVKGSGSMLQTKNFSNAIDYEYPETLLNLGLRFFTPTEVARLHGFPVDELVNGRKRFEFPERITLKQKWRLLGNSLNVVVVAELIKMTFSNYLRYNCSLL